MDEARGDVLIVDDNPANLRLLADMLDRHGHLVRVAAGGAQALKSVTARSPDVILLDIRMPGMDGFEVCRRLKADAATREIPIIFLSASNETDDKVRAFEVGGVDYVTKPFQAEEVAARVRTQVELGQSRTALRLAYTEMEQRAEQKSRELVSAQQSQLHMAERLSRSLKGTINAVALALEKRDPYTAGHQRGVAEVTVAIATRLGFEADTIEGIRLGAMIHDLGKIAVPAEILSRPGRVSAIEFGLIKSHAEVGYEIIKEVDFPWPVAQMVRQHHERMDGSGYPLGLDGAQILPESRIIAVADVIEAMSSHRPYRAALGLDAAMAEVAANRGKLYDAPVADAALALWREGGFDWLRTAVTHHG